MSIRKRLLVLLLAASAGVWIVSGVLAYAEARRELNEVFDAELAGAARLLLAQAAHELREGDEPDDEPLLEEELDMDGADAQGLVFQFWSPEGRLLYRSSSDAPRARLSQLERGFTHRVIDGVAWRVFSQWDKRRIVQVQVAQQIEKRRALTRRLALRLLGPTFLALPPLALLIWLAVAKGLAPLHRIAEEVGRRGPKNLSPLTGRAPRELEPMVARLNELFAALDAALARERRFTADAAHELRTPLAALKTQAEVALRARDEAERRHALEQIGAGVDRTAHLAQQLLTLARLEPESALGSAATVDLRAVVLEALRDAGEMLVAKEVEVDVEALEPVQVRGDAVLLGILARNLIDNAVRYGPRGGRLTLRARQQGDRALLEIIDEGPGIPAVERERVLERFYRVPGSEAPGSGLGLSIVERVVKLHGGTVTLGPGPGERGLAVVVALPAAG